MASIRARLVNFGLRHFVKRKLAACKTPLDVRTVFNASMAFTPRGVRFTPAELGGVSGEWTEASSQSPRATLLYLHGGGYVAMSPRTHRPITAAYAKRGFRVFAADYRLAPEHRFPAALDDATAAWRALRESVEGPIFLSGDSAGGGLSLALLLNLRDKGERMPDAACVFSPWTDLAITGRSMKSNAKRDPMLVSEGIEVVVTAYAGETDPHEPLVSPLYGDFHGLPPIQINVGDSEILLDDAVRVAERARGDGVDVDLRVIPDMPHVWQFLNRITPEARMSMDEAAGYLLAKAGAD